MGNNRHKEQSVDMKSNAPNIAQNQRNLRKRKMIIRTYHGTYRLYCWDVAPAQSSEVLWTIEVLELLAEKSPKRCRFGLKCEEDGRGRGQIQTGETREVTASVDLVLGFELGITLDVGFAMTARNAVWGAVGGSLMKGCAVGRSKVPSGAFRSRPVDIAGGSLRTIQSMARPDRLHLRRPDGGKENLVGDPCDDCN